MLFLDAGLVGAVYLGARLIEIYRKKKGQLRNASAEIEKNDVIEREQNGTAIEKSHDTEDASEDKAVGKVSWLHVKASVATIVLSVLRIFYPVIYPLQMAVVCFVVFPIFRRAEASLTEEKKFRAPVLTTVFLLACIATGQYIALGIGGIFFLSAARIVAKTRRDLKEKLTGIFGELPDKVWILKDDIEIEVPLDEVCIDDIVVVNTGNIVPVDGVVTDGAATIDQHTLTGEFQPAEKNGRRPGFCIHRRYERTNPRKGRKNRRTDYSRKN